MTGIWGSCGFLVLAPARGHRFPKAPFSKCFRSSLERKALSDSSESDRSVWMAGLKPRPNDFNMPTQHIATLLGATCCVRLATLLRNVATCWVLLVQISPFSNLSQQHTTCRNTSQHGGQTHTTSCAQQCCDMLRYVALTCCDRLAGT